MMNNISTSSGLSTERASQKDEELVTNKKSKLRSISQQLLWVTLQTSPDTSFESCRASSYGKIPEVRNLLGANKAVKKLQSSTLRLVYSDLGNPEYLKVIVYRNANHASLPSGAPQGAQIVFLCGNRTAPIICKSMRLERVTKKYNGDRHNGSCRISRCRPFYFINDKRDIWINSPKSVLQNRYQITGKRFNKFKR